MSGVAGADSSVGTDRAIDQWYWQCNLLDVLVPSNVSPMVLQEARQIVHCKGNVRAGAHHQVACSANKQEILG